MTFDDLWGQTSLYANLLLHIVDILEKLNKKYSAEKDDFEILRRPYVTFNDHWGHALFNLRLIMLTIIESFIKIGSWIFYKEKLKNSRVF